MPSMYDLLSAEPTPPRVMRRMHGFSVTSADSPTPLKHCEESASRVKLIIERDEKEWPSELLPDLYRRTWTRPVRPFSWIQHDTWEAVYIVAEGHAGVCPREDCSSTYQLVISAGTTVQVQREERYAPLDFQKKVVKFTSPAGHHFCREQGWDLQDPIRYRALGYIQRENVESLSREIGCGRSVSISCLQYQTEQTVSNEQGIRIKRPVGWNVYYELVKDKNGGKWLRAGHSAARCHSIVKYKVVADASPLPKAPYVRGLYIPWNNGVIEHGHDQRNDLFRSYHFLRAAQRYHWELMLK